MNSRPILLSLILCTCAWSVPAFGQESPKLVPTEEEKANAQVAGPEELSLYVFPLRHIPAETALEVVKSVLGDTLGERGKLAGSPAKPRRMEGARFGVDDRMNRLIARVDLHTKKTIEALLLKLDQPQEHFQLPVMALRLRFADPNEVQEAIRQLSFNSISTYADQRTKTLFAKGPDEAMARVKTLVEKLDGPAMLTQARAGVLLRIVWLVDKSLTDAEAAPVPEEWKTPIEHLRKQLGLGELRTATQIVVGLDPVDGAQFESTATAKLKQGWVLEASGRMSQKVAGEEQLRLQLSAQPVATKEKLCKLDTTCSGALRGQPMIVGMTMVGSQPSVFVIHFLPE